MNSFKKSILCVMATVFGVACFARISPASVEVVNGFGVDNWYSWDTRNDTGTQLVGTNDTNPYGSTYFGVPATSANDTAISNQIVFMGEGQTVNDAAGNTPPASPTGSLNSLGYVRLDGTDNNSGKSDISYVNTSGIAAASTLLLPTFSTSYTFYPQSNPTSREPGLNISLIGADTHQYTFSYTEPLYTSNAWNTANVDNTTSQFSLYVTGVGPVGSNTLAGWALDPTYGPAMFGPGAEVFRVGFNIGSGQHNGLAYLDDVQTSLLNGGDVIDFQAASVPEPASLSLIGVGAFALLRRRKRLA